MKNRIADIKMLLCRLTLMANTCTEPSFLMSGHAGTKQNTRKPQNTLLKSPNVLPSEIHDIYEELSEIYHKLQQERTSQQEYSLHLKRREQSLLEKEEMLLKHQATLSKIKDVEEIVHQKFQIMKERRCSDTDNDPDRCSVAVWSLESCHTDSSPATNDQGKDFGIVETVFNDAEVPGEGGDRSFQGSDLPRMINRRERGEFLPVPSPATREAMPELTSGATVPSSPDLPISAAGDHMECRLHVSSPGARPIAGQLALSTRGLNSVDVQRPFSMASEQPPLSHHCESGWYKKADGSSSPP
ncbi:unnamed protein product [Ranitomeya imitator]|uniref:Uncharacterized protein n=1 Tax=Ranitomeya imitator TaxID=111125 RepID=A0ABN9KS15_9NEOB|nr:unnamed protein product [Ranitomeya imitator]